MNVRTAFIASLIALSLNMSYVPPSQAESIVFSVHAFFVNGSKKVKFRVINETGQPLEVKIEDQITTLNVDQPFQVNLPVGSRIIVNKATGQFKIGDVLVQVADTYRDANVILHNN